MAGSLLQLTLIIGLNRATTFDLPCIEFWRIGTCSSKYAAILLLLVGTDSDPHNRRW